MIRCKDLVSNDQIGSLNEWFGKCPPQRGLKQWVDGRSAKETAKHWIYTIPQSFKDILKGFKLEFEVCSPEFVTRFDNNGDNGRNHDLFIIAKNENKETIVISVESKVDEEFDKTLIHSINNAKTALIKNPTSKVLKRIEELRLSIFGKTDENQLGLRYQLLTAIAGTLAEAKIQNATKAIFIIQTFTSEDINKDCYMRNQNDLNNFIHHLTNGNCSQLKEGELIGPLKVPGNQFIPNNIDLYIGKCTIEI